MRLKSQHHVAALEVAAQVDAELPALVRVEARLADAVVLAVEAAHAELPVARAQRRAVEEVQAAQAIVAPGVFRDAFGRVADHARHEVDRTGGRVGIEHRRRTAAHDFDALDGLVQAEHLVGVEVAQRGIVLHRDAVLEQVHRAEAVDRDAARADVAAGFAAGRLDPEAGHRLHRLGHRRRRLHAQAFLVDARDRVAGLGLAALLDAGTAGDDDGVELRRFARGIGGCDRRGLCMHRRGQRGDDSEREGVAKGVAMRAAMRVWLAAHGAGVP